MVSLSPGMTESMFAVGAGSLLVGRSRFCDFPPEARALPVVGGYVDPNYEAILALHPSLVVGARGPAGAGVAMKLEGEGIATYFPTTDSLADVDALLLGLGERTGHTRDAEALVARIHADEADVEAKVAGEARPRVLVLFGLQPIVACGPGGFADEMVRRAGGQNVVTEGGAYPMLGMERVLALDPDLILNGAVLGTHASDERTLESPGFRELRAVKAQRVFPLRDESTLRPGPRVAEGLRVLARAMHPAAAL